MADTELTRASFDAVDWQGVIAACPEKDAAAYFSAFNRAAEEAEKGDDTDASRVYRLLAAACSMMLRAESKTEPFTPVLVLRDGRTSPNVDYFSRQEVELFRELAPTTADGEMRARLADIAWLRLRDFKMAQLAVRAYIESGRTLEDPKNWSPGAHRLERALRLAVSLGKGGSAELRAASDEIESVLARYGGEDPLYQSAHLMELLLEYRLGNPSTYVQLSETAAKRAEATQDWRRARTHWEVKAKWHARASDPKSERECLILAAETYVREADKAVSGDSPSYMVAAAHLQSAVEAFRRISGCEKRREELHKRLLRAQERSVSEMRPVSVELDITHFIEQAQGAVRGKSLIEALVALALIHRSPSAPDLKERARKMSEEFVFSSLIPKRLVDALGRTTDVRPDIHSSDPAEAEAGLLFEALNLANQERGYIVAAVLDPARQQIALEHRVRPHDLLPVLSNNPFVPPDREILFARGLAAGFEGDWILAGHALIPQIENSLRYVLDQHDVITSGLTSKGVQDVRLLNNLLERSELVSILGEDLIFDLRGLLVEDAGANLRNLIAHGLVDASQFSSAPIVYAWWLTLRLCLWPVIARSARSTVADLDLSPSDDDQAPSQLVAQNDQ
jgi:hypothetical protein